MPSLLNLMCCTYHEIVVCQYSWYVLCTKAEKPPLSPLPVRRTHATSPRKVSNNHSVYVSPHKPMTSSVITPQSRLLYCFNRSPARVCCYSQELCSKAITITIQSRLSFQFQLVELVNQCSSPNGQGSGFMIQNIFHFNMPFGAFRSAFW